MEVKRTQITARMMVNPIQMAKESQMRIKRIKLKKVPNLLSSSLRRIQMTKRSSKSKKTMKRCTNTKKVRSVIQKLMILCLMNILNKTLTFLIN